MEKVLEISFFLSIIYIIYIYIYIIACAVCGEKSGMWRRSLRFLSFYNILYMYIYYCVCCLWREERHVEEVLEISFFLSVIYIYIYIDISLHVLSVARRAACGEGP